MRSPTFRLQRYYFIFTYANYESFFVKKRVFFINFPQNTCLIQKKAVNLRHNLEKYDSISYF